MYFYQALVAHSVPRLLLLISAAAKLSSNPRSFILASAAPSMFHGSVQQELLRARRQRLELPVSLMVVQTALCGRIAAGELGTWKVLGRGRVWHG